MPHYPSNVTMLNRPGTITHQQRKKYLEYLANGPSAFNLYFTLIFQREDSKWMEQAVEIICNRYEVLRTTYGYSEGEVFQNIHLNLHPAVEIVHFNLVNDEQRDEIVSDLLDGIESIKSNLDTGPIIHIRLVAYNQEKSGMIFGLHHISADEHSMRLIKSEIEIIFNGLREGRTVSLASPKYQIHEYAAWVDQYVASKKGQAMMEAYKEKVIESILADETIIPSDDSYSKYLSIELMKIVGESRPGWYDRIFGNVIHLTPIVSHTYIVYIDEPGLLRLNDLVDKFSASLFIIMLACFCLLISIIKHTRFTRICIPSSIHRSMEEWASVVGWLTGEIVFCQEIDVNQTISELVNKVALNLYSSSMNQFYPFENLLRDLDYPIYVTSPVLVNMIRDKDTHIENFESAHIEAGNGNFEFESCIVEYSNGLCLKMMYDTEIYTATEIEMICNMYFQLLDQFCFCNKEDLVMNFVHNH